MIAADIKNILNEREYCYYGLRADSFDYEIGDLTNVSHQLFPDPQYDDYGELKCDASPNDRSRTGLPNF